MSLHTPGPWFVKPVHSEANHSAIVLNDGKGGWVMVVQHNGEGIEARQQADAALVATSPDLLAFAERVSVGPLANEDDLIRWIGNLRRDAAGLVAKAKGK